MLVRDGDDYLELTATELYTLVYGEGDTRFVVRVRVSSLFAEFTAESLCWVELRALAAFVEQLRVLEERRQGAAAVESMSPGELRLEVSTIDRAGHVAAVVR